MRLSKSQAALLNARELRLVTAKGPREVTEIATAIRQVRDLRDKQRDLLQRQDARLARSGAGRVGAIGVANERTAAKERLLDEALDELQQELRRIDQESSQACRELLDNEDADEVPGRRANPKKASKRAGAKRAAKKSPSTGRAAKKSTASKSAAKRAGASTKKATGKRASAKRSA